MFVLKKRSYFFFKSLNLQNLLFKKGFLAFFDFFFFKSSLFFDLRNAAQTFGFFFFFLNSKFLSFFFNHSFFFFFKPGLFLVTGFGSKLNLNSLDSFYKDCNTNIFLVSFCLNGFFFNSSSLTKCIVFWNALNIDSFCIYIYVYVYNFLIMFGFFFFFILFYFISCVF